MKKMNKVFLYRVLNITTAILVITCKFSYLANACSSMFGETKIPEALKR